MIHSPDRIKTGDVLLCQGSGLTAFILQVGISNVYNHSGIAVRFKSIDPPVVSLTEEGELFMLEINVDDRYDRILKQQVTGISFTDYNFMLSRYNRLVYRPMREEYRCQELADKTLEFVRNYKDYVFPTDIASLLGISVGFSFREPLSDNKCFCTELIAYYYPYVLKEKYKELNGCSDADYIRMFGKSIPKSSNTIVPDSYTVEDNPHNTVLVNSTYTVYIAYSNFWPSILFPICFTLIALIILWLLLPGNGLY